MLSLHTLPSNPATSKRRKRVGRGNASGHGTTATRGTKGQRARTGGRKHIKKRSIKSLIMHIPKMRGFTALRREVPGIPLDRLLAAVPNASRIGIVEVRAAGFLPRTAYRFKVIGPGPARKVTVVADGFSESAKAALEKAGGEARLTTRKP
jgi:large subunit ribosomal protein L15